MNSPALHRYTFDGNSTESHPHPKTRYTPVIKGCFYDVHKWAAHIEHQRHSSPGITVKTVGILEASSNG
jgi:hypothetical protein